MIVLILKQRHRLMRKLLLIIGLSTLLFFSCSKNKDIDDIIEGGDLNEMKTARADLESQLGTLTAEINKLDKAISKIDTADGKYHLVKGARVIDSAYHHFIELHANIETQQDVNITPEYAGVLNLRVQEGQRVGRGATLATISDGGLREQLNQAKIQVDMARSQLKQAEIQRDLAHTTYQKQTQLWNQKIGSEMQFLQAKTNYETSQKAVEVARQQIAAAQKGVANVNAQLAKTNLRAPFSGVVEQVITKSGQVVAPGTPILRLVNDNTIKAVSEVPEQHLENIKVGTEAKVVIPALDKTINGKINLVSASINPSNRSFKVEMPLSSEGGTIKPNLNAKMLLNDYTSDDAIVIPESTVRQDADGEYVYIVEKFNNKNMGLAKKVTIETGKHAEGFVEIIAGLHSGDMLILEVPKNLNNGDKVKLYK